MTAACGLLGFALLVGLGGERLLRGARWPHRSPALGILAWQGLIGAVVLSVVLAGVTLAMPEIHFAADPGRTVRAFLIDLSHQYATPLGAAESLAGVGLTVGVLARLGHAWRQTVLVASRQRREHLWRVALVADRVERDRYLLVRHEEPMVYCVPGRRSEVVVTSAATRMLSAAELSGVLAHEGAHLRARHHVAVSAARMLSHAFLGRRPFATAATHVAALVEMHADDAVSVTQRQDLARALFRMAQAGGRVPAGSLGAGGPTALARIVRLSQPRRPLPVLASLPIVTVSAALVLAPVLLTLLPAGFAAASHCCGMPA